MEYYEKRRKPIEITVLENNEDGSVSVLVEQVPWRISQRTLEKMKEPLKEKGKK